MTLAERVKAQSHRFRSVPAGRLILGVLAILTAVQTARFFWILITPVGPVNDWRAPSVNLVPQPARMALFAGFDPFFRGQTGASHSNARGMFINLSLSLCMTSGLSSCVGCDAIILSLFV